MFFVNPAFSPCEQGSSAIRTAFAAAHKRYLAHLVDHPGWFGVNWLWYFIGLFGGPQMRILGGSIIRWTFSCDFTFISVIQVLPEAGHTGEGSWVNVNLLDNPSWPSNPGGMKLSTPRYLTFLPYLALKFYLVLYARVGFKFLFWLQNRVSWNLGCHEKPG